VIVIIADTLRKDYAKLLENELKRLGFISYDNAITPSPWTTPAHASIFTGLYPTIHGAHETKNRKIYGVRLKKNEDTLPLRLMDLDYETFLLTANPFVTPQFGFTGFNYFHLTMPVFSILSNRDKKIRAKLTKKYSPKNKIELIKMLIHNRQYRLLTKIIFNFPFRNISQIINNWPIDKGANNTIRILKKLTLRASSKTPKFIFINLMETHEPYSRNEENPGTALIENLKTNKLDRRYVHIWRKKYPKEAKYVSKKILEIIKLLKDRKIFDSSLIIVTSDHGQLLGEHGRINHGIFLYEELLRIPLFIKYPEITKINIIQEKAKYISLVKLKDFIINLIQNKLENDSILYSNTVFAESHGIHENLAGKIRTDKEKEKLEKFEKWKIAVYNSDFKGIFNINEWKFEKIFTYNPNKEINEDIIKRLKREIIRYLKNITTVKF